MYQILIGTAKGLIVYQGAIDKKPELKSIHFAGFAVNMVYQDERTNRWWAGVSHKHWVQKLHYTDNQGETWQSVKMPSYNGRTLPSGNTAKLRQIWCMTAGGKDKPNELWLGTDPGGLFYSKNNGETFELVESLWNHPSRQKEGQWFGAGSDFPFIHTIIVNPSNSNHIYIAVSCAGVFESKDGGISWHPKNKGLVAAYLPNPNVEVGHDPHLLVISEKNPNILWQQNHCGVFYTKDSGENWIDVSVENGIPNYGFAIAMDEEQPAKAWVIPVESDEQRIAPNFQLQVFATNNFGKTWQSESQGLPQEHIFDIVLRHAFVKKGNFLIFGTTSGNVYFSLADKIKWERLTTNLTKVNVIEVF